MLRTFSSLNRFDALNFAELAVLSGGEDAPSVPVPADEYARIKTWIEAHEQAPVAATKGAGEDLEISILGVIGGGFWGDGISARSVKRILDEHRTAKTIRVLIDSPGGDYFDGVAIMNMLRRHQARVIVEVLGEATSAGSVIAMGGDRVEMRLGTLMMIHRAWSCACGNGDDMRGAADLLDKVDAGLLAVYEARTKKDREYLAKLVAATTWMDPSQAVADGFAEEALAIDAKAGAVKPKDDEIAPADLAPPPPVASPTQPLPAALGAL